MHVAGNMLYSYQSLYDLINLKLADSMSALTAAGKCQAAHHVHRALHVPLHK